MKTPASYFSGDYVSARDRFLTASARSGGSMMSYGHPGRGRHGETLSTDIVVLGNANASSMLLIQSGTHGIEGYCGSAIQLALLELLTPFSIDGNMALMLVHGINPFGFSWCSRGDENNVDLNRNFIDFDDAGERRNDIFQELAPHLVPDEWSRESLVKADAELDKLRQEYGHDAISQSLRRGQYSYPDNLFYGGTGPSWSRLTIERIGREHLSAVTELLLLDIHSGLGDYGDVGLLSVEPDTSKKFGILRQIFGQQVRSTHNPHSGAANAGGNIIRGYTEILPDVTVPGTGMEFGTYEQERVQAALRADTWLHHKMRGRTLPRSLQEEIKQEMFEVFCPADQSWRDIVVKEGCKICQTAVKGLETLQGVLTGDT